eukprot:Skav211054  [mRNA]  locus=scaffold5518:798:6705:+ [translate_table: standard]
MLKIGCPMAVKHNEVAPGQHEMSPVFRTANVSCDSNVCFMEVMNREAQKLGLQAPGAKLYVTAIACLAYGLAQYNEMVRCTVASAGNDHRLGAQEAPPAIISLYPGQGFEQFMESLAEKKKQSTGCSAAMHIEANVEDRNRTAPFPFCGNRFEFRAVGSSQNCCFPVMVCNAIMSAGPLWCPVVGQLKGFTGFPAWNLRISRILHYRMEHMAGLIEGGMSHRDAVAQAWVFKENKHVIFTGNGYSAEWPIEANKRGLPNLNTTPKAIATKLLESLKIYTEEETEAPKLRNFSPKSSEQDLEKYKGFDKLAGSRKTVYEGILDHLEKLKTSFASKPHSSLAEEATYLCDTVKPLMVNLRQAVDKAEGLMETGLYPYPTYEAMIYSHHF